MNIGYIVFQNSHLYVISKRSKIKKWNITYELYGLLNDEYEFSDNLMPL